ncbi:protein FAM200C-like [Watersipora subatra]|uniref:protein FAM200C-like n=1 Tax=Watersipora subatra TaxID=2589382 RepID=UPI00355C1536
MDTHNIPLDKIIGVATDGAPAMVGRQSGFVKHLMDVTPTVVPFHCIIHKNMLRSKLNADYKNLMLNIMRMINFFKNKSALRHRQLRAFLQNLEAEYDELLTHNNVRNEVDSFLSEIDTEEANLFLELPRSEQKMVDMAVLVDFLSYMNDQNVKPQGDGKYVIHL